MYIITGFGRSGTSFVAALVHQLGIPMGQWNNKVKAGYEHPVVGGSNKSILNGDYWGTIKEKKKLIELSSTLQIVKDPRFIMTLGVWLDAGAKIDGVLFCKRPHADIIKSSRKTHAGLMVPFMHWDKIECDALMDSLLRGFLKLCSTAQIKVEILPYPEITNDFSKLDPLINVIKQEPDRVKKVWDVIRVPR